MTPSVVPPSSTRSRPRPAALLVVGFAALLSIGVLGLAGCSSDGTADADNAAATSVPATTDADTPAVTDTAAPTPAPAPTATAEPAAETATSDNSLTLNEAATGSAPLGPLGTLQARLNGQSLVAQPFCFAGTGIAGINGESGSAESGSAESGIAWVDVGAAGLVTIFAYQPGEVPVLFTGNETSEPGGTFELQFQSEQDSAITPPAVTVALADDTLRMGTATLDSVPCDEISTEVDGLFVLLSSAVLELPAGAERLPNVAPSVWRFVSDGPVNARSGPSVSTDIVGTWEGTETDIASTGRRANADGFEWIELEADEERPRNWVASDFIEEE